MQHARPPTKPTLPWMLVPLVRLLRWGRRRVRAIVGPSAQADGTSDVGEALLLVGTITGAAMMGSPPLLTLGGGIGLAVLFVVARSWIVVQDEQAG
jgi:hypothetical protein